MTDPNLADPDYARHGGFPQFEPARPGPGFGRFLTAMRRAQDLAVSADPDRQTWDAAADRVEELVALLAPFEAAEGVGPANRVPGLPGAGSLLMPPYHVSEFTADGVELTAQFSRGWLREAEGRKAFVNAELTDPDGTLLAEANGLMVRLLPGQP